MPYGRRHGNKPNVSNDGEIYCALGCSLSSRPIPPMPNALHYWRRLDIVARMLRQIVALHDIQSAGYFRRSTICTDIVVGTELLLSRRHHGAYKDMTAA